MIAAACDPQLQQRYLRDFIDEGDVEALVGLADSEGTADLPARTLVLLGDALRRWEQTDAAVALLEGAARRHPGDLWLHFTLGQALEAANRPTDAVRHYTAVVAIRPESAAAHAELGRLLMAPEARDLEGAEHACRTSIRLDPTRGYVHFNLGSTLGHTGRHEEAIAAFRKSLQLEPGYWLAHFHIGFALEALGRLEEAEAAYRAALGVNPGFAGAHTRLGLLLGRQGRQEEALAAHREALRSAPTDPMAHCNMGFVLGLLGRHVKALPYLYEALRLDSNLALAHYNLGVSLQALGRLDDAIDAFRAGVRLSPEHANTHVNLGSALARSGDLDQAILAFREAIRLDLDSAQAHANLGEALLEKRRLPEAEQAVREAIRLDPTFATAHATLGVVLHRRGSSEEAIEVFREAVRLDPADARTHYLFGLTLFQMGQYAQAREAFHTAEALGVEDPMWPDRFAGWVALCDRSAALAARLPAVLRGDDQPLDARERIALANVALQTGQPKAATRLYAEAIAEDPEAPKPSDIYNAACAALRAGSLPGGVEEQAAYRQKARQWLQQSLALSRENMPGSRLAQMLEHWLQDPDLGSVRGEAAIDALPKGERAAWRTLWAAVQGALDESANAGG